MIGNDIIDLEIARAERKFENQRFKNKVFTDSEKDQIINSRDPELCLWKFWAMKETAYKAHQRNFNLPRKLNPKAFRCVLEISNSRGKVSIDDSVYHIELDITADYLHATTSSERVFKDVFQKDTDSAFDLIKQITGNYIFKTEDLSIKKNSLGIPSLVFKEHSTEFPFSLSHHGKFTAFAIPLINS